MTLSSEIYAEYRKHIEDNFELNKNGALAMRTLLEHSPLYWNSTVEKTLHIPKVFAAETIAHFREIAAAAYRIFGKVIAEYRQNGNYRKLFPFSPELEELILLPKQYNGFLPIARFDLFYNEETEDFYFCEINTDGTAAMLRDLELGKALIENPAHQQVIRHYRLSQFELFDSYVREFLSLYDSYPYKKNAPNIAIVDFLENATLRDFEEFARRFQAIGYSCEICDIRSLTYKNQALYSASGNRIDAIYRRAVTADIMANFSGIGPFLQAIKDNTVFLAGAFETQILHTKWLFHVLRLEETQGILTAEENEFVKKHIPTTTLLASGYIDREEVQNKKNSYMIKPIDAYASKGIYAAGREYEQQDWDNLIDGLWEKGYICQQYCPQYETENIDFAWGDGAWRPYINMPGLYMYNGKFAGILMRMAPGGQIIVAHENERTVPVFVAQGRK